MAEIAYESIRKKRRKPVNQDAEMKPGRLPQPVATETRARPSRQEAEQAVETLIRWAGDDPSREGLLETPARVIRAFEDHFAGYGGDPATLLARSFDDLAGFDDFVLVRQIDFTSHCEHHMAPIIGVAHVAYWPDRHVVGISKLARLVDIYARRLSSQETMTRAIADALETHLKPKGVAVTIDATHHCMASRGALKRNSSTVTSQFTGIFRTDGNVQRRFLDSIKS